MKRTTATQLAACSGVFLLLASNALADKNTNAPIDPPRLRVFTLDYGATLKGLPSGSRVRIWLPVPQSGDHQQIKRLDIVLPVPGRTTREPVYGNKLLYFETKGPTSGSLVFTTSYLVRRREVRALKVQLPRDRLTNQERDLFLSANRLVPVNGKQLDLLDDIQFSHSPLSIARTLYDRVDAHLRYDKSRPGYGNGDVPWVCDSRFGNCTDFHSLFISWARAKGLPARFEIGFSLSAQRGTGTIGGYHCWALFHSELRGWVPVDISEADKHPHLKDYCFGNLTEDRVTFTTGRDLELTPKQDGAPLNYFVYPYVEVDGNVWPTDRVTLSISYADLKDKTDAK